MKSKFRIQLIDDDTDMLMAIKRSLSKAGFSMETREDLSSGMRLFREYLPHLLILDVVLPDGNGLETAHELLNNPLYEGLNIILISGNRKSKQDFDNAYRYGVIDYITKPLDIRDLVQKVEIIYRVYQLIQKQKQTEDKYQDLINKSGDLIFSLNKDLKTEMMNPQIIKLLGLQKEDYPAKRFKNFVLADDKPLWDKAIKSVLNNEIISAFEMRLADKNNNIIPVSVLLSPVINNEGSVDGVMGIARDLSQQKLLNLDSSETHKKIRTRELKSWSDLSSSKTGKTAGLYQGSSPFAEDSEIFLNYCEKYRNILDKMVEKRIYKIQYQQTLEIRDLANELGFLKASPKEVIKINSFVIKDKMNKEHPRKLMVYHEEARVVMLELLGYLTSYYRNRS